jgi:hypothetical protein
MTMTMMMMIKMQSLRGLLISLKQTTLLAEVRPQPMEKRESLQNWKLSVRDLKPHKAVFLTIHKTRMRHKI